MITQEKLSDTHCRTFSPTYSKIRESVCMYLTFMRRVSVCTGFDLALLYSTWALFATCLIHKHTIFFLCFFYYSAFCVTFTHIYALMDISESNSGLVSCPRVFGTQTGAVRSISKWPALPPELQTPLLLPVFASLFCSCPNLFWALFISTKSKKLF